MGVILWLLSDLRSSIRHPARARRPDGAGARAGPTGSQESPVPNHSEAMEAVDYLLLRGHSNPRPRPGFRGVEVLDRVPDWDRLWRSYDRWSRVIVRMRQKVVVPALPIAPARWVVDPDFDLGYHLRRVSLPAPGTLRQVLDLAEQILESP